MSQKVNYDHKFTDEEREYLRTRAREHEVTANDRKYAQAGVSQEVLDDVSQLTVAELKAELDELGVEYGGAKKAELQELLANEWAKDG